MTYSLVIVTGIGHFLVGTFTGPSALVDCVTNAQRITLVNRDQRKRGEEPTYINFHRAHCERLDKTGASR